MNIQSAKAMIHAASLVDDAILMEGPHGIGKSQIVEEFSDENGFYMYPLFLSHQDVGDIIGNPVTIEKDGHQLTTWTVPIWLQRMREKAAQGIRCVLFLDELNRAPLDVRQSALQLVLEGKIHEHELPVVDGHKTLIVSAINPAGDYQVDELDEALLDRFVHAEVEADVEAWLAYAKKKELNHVVRDFIAEFPDRLHWSPADGGVGSSPRSWTKLAKFMDVVDQVDKSVVFSFMKGRVGKEIASQFYTYFKNYVNVVKVEDVEAVVSEYADKTNTIEELSEHVADLMSRAEAIQKTEMAHKLKDKYNNKKDMLPYLAFLYSLEVELVVSFLKKVRADDPKHYTKLVKFDNDVNNKELFKRIVVASERS